MTTMTSYSILITISIIFCMIFSIVILGAKYTWWHYIGSVIAIIGVVSAAYYDLQDSNPGKYFSKMIWGDILIFFGEICIALFNK